MNILHVVDMISQKKAGGSAKVPYQLGKAQVQMGHKVTIYTSDYDAADQEAPCGVELVKFHCVWNLLGGIRITPSMVNADFKKFDIIHLHNYRTFVNLVAANKGVPVVLQSHGSNRQMNGLTKPIHNLIWRKLIFNKAKAYIADAEIEIMHYMDEGANKEDIYLIPVGIDFREFKSMAESLPSEKKKVLFLGRLHKNKGCELLIRAFNLLNRDDVKLQISGINYGEEAKLKQLVKEIGIGHKIEWLGPCHGEAKPYIYRNADVYVMPSRYEMFGLTFLEALACGTPVIMTNICGAAALLPKECGYVVPYDETILASAIQSVLDDNLVNIYRDYRKDWARQYDWSNLAPRHIEVYEKVLNGK